MRVSASAFLHSGVMLNYDIRSRCFVHLDIYAISGKRVAVMDQGEREPGEYSAVFNTARIPAGLYVCRFQAGNYQMTSRIVVTK